jgi:hypothetical protein
MEQVEALLFGLNKYEISKQYNVYFWFSGHGDSKPL